MKTAMVWGAGGDIGAALVTRLTEEDWKVVGVARDPGSVSDRASEVLEADVADPQGVARAVERSKDAAGQVDLWVYAIGDIVSVKVEDMSLEDWDRILAANQGGAYLAVQQSLPLLTPDAHIIFLGAVSERLRLPGLAAYASAKAGLEAFAEVLRKEQRGRRVSVVRPKAVKTGLWEKVPFSVPHGALEPSEVADRILQAYREGHTGVLDL